ncbi:MAG: serine/threonine protein kinase, partial [Myxococcales bacterium]
MAAMNQPSSPDLDNDESVDDDNEASKRRARERLGSFVAQKWHLEALLGVGGMASVYEARHRNGKRVAIKILHPELALSGDTLRRFLREGYLANAVEHPDVVSVLDDGMTDDGLPYLVMEYLEGESLDGRLERISRPLQLPDVLSIGCTLLDVLHAAHARGIVHRDLKPDNVFLTLDGGVKVFDFGIARLQDAHPNNRHATRTGIAMGTPTFMSREQAHGDLKLIDGRTDIWALGATLYYALTSDFPYEARSVAEYMAKLMTADPRPLRSLDPTIPEPIAEVIDRALRHDLGRRWQNALDMRLRLIEAAGVVGITIPAQPGDEGFIMPTAPRIRLASFPDERPSMVQKQKNLSSLPTSAGGFDAPGRISFTSPTPGTATPIP